MPGSFRIDKQRKLVITTAIGALTREESLQHQQLLLHDPDFDPSFSQLLDFTQVTSVNLTAQDVRLLAATTIFSPTSRRAVLTSSEEQFGLSRMFAILRDTKGETGIRVFRSREEAMRWVMKEDLKK